MVARSFLSFLGEDPLPLAWNSELNPVLWDEDQQLKPGIREALIAFALHWAEYAGIPDTVIQEVWMLGGNCNYNWTSFSDIDVHLEVDRTKLGISLGIYDPTALDSYLKDKKLLWTLTHKPTVKGYPLEPYAEDINDVHPAGQGIFSLTRNEWVAPPTEGSFDWADDETLQKKVEYYVGEFDRLMGEGAEPEAFDELWDEIAKKRSQAVRQGGEFAQANLVFKALRNLGVLERVSDYRAAQVDRRLSLE